ncbi:MAG: CPBP family intramembrane metalloprotease [Actinobacteria bacterium]|nr:CPBP family intramembrane metalloprotease [Actinomycetota bacterium]
MGTNLAAEPVERPRPGGFPYATWGGWAAVLGVIGALAAGVALAIPFSIIGNNGHGELDTFGNIGVQAMTELGFLLVPMAIAAQHGASTLALILARLGFRRFRPSALKWMGATVIAYLVFNAVYVAVFGEPHQEDIAEGFGPVPVQVLLIVILAPISEEICFRGMLYGGLRTKLPMLPAALIGGLVFGGLHALTGVSAVPPLIVFGFLLCLLYERTGSIVPGIVLHMLNNSVALLGQ